MVKATARHLRIVSGENLQNHGPPIFAKRSDAFSHYLAVGYYEGRAPIALEVNEDWYLSTYPDVANALMQGVVDSAEEHFVRNGYREGRLPADPEIDPRWYAATYLGAGVANDATQGECFDHFVTIGYLNGALPRPRI